ncbi:MAG: SIS domain-containing protein, partial [Dehalococcoidia bacterium]
MLKRSNHWQELIRDQLRESAEVKLRISDTCREGILMAAEAIAHSLQGDGKLMLCGNGGSAADSQHIATELVSRLTADFPRPAIPAIALTTDTSCLTAIGNDYGFEHIFQRQVEALGRDGDVLMGISTSGNSENVIRAIKTAKERGITTIGLLGRRGGSLASMVDLAIVVPSQDTQRIQEGHIAVGHIICDLV